MNTLPHGEVFTPTDEVDGQFNTFDPDTGLLITLAGTPSIRIERLRSGTWSEITGNGITLDEDADHSAAGARTGRHSVNIDLDDANIAAQSGDRYDIVLHAGTVDGDDMAHVLLGHFYVQSDGLTTAQKADVNAQADLALTDYDPPTKAELDVLGTTALATEAKQDTIDANVDTLLTRITSTLFAGITSLAEWLGLLAGKQTGDATARTELQATGAGSGTYDETTDSQEAIRDTDDAIKAVTDNLPDSGSLSDLAAILVDTDTTIPALIAALNDLTAAQVNAEVDTALSDMFGAARAEPSSVPAANADALAKLDFVYARLRNKLVNDGTTEALRDDGDTADIGSATIDLTAGTLTKGKYTSA